MYLCLLLLRKKKVEKSFSAHMHVYVAAPTTPQQTVPVLAPALLLSRFWSVQVSVSLPTHVAAVCPSQTREAGLWNEGSVISKSLA